MELGGEFRVFFKQRLDFRFIRVVVGGFNFTQFIGFQVDFLGGVNTILRENFSQFRGKSGKICLGGAAAR